MWNKEFSAVDSGVLLACGYASLIYWLFPAMTIWALVGLSLPSLWRLGHKILSPSSTSTDS